jgi:hypothetical protein
MARAIASETLLEFRQFGSTRKNCEGERYGGANEAECHDVPR